MTMYSILTPDAWTGPIAGDAPKGLPHTMHAITYREAQARAGRGNKGKPKSPEHAAKLRAAAAKATAARKVKAAARRGAQ